MSSADGLSAFLRVLRNVAYKTTKFLFDTVLNTVCVVLLIASCLAPWRLCSMVFGWSSFRRTFDHMEWDINHNWRWPSVIHFYRTLVDCLILPFAVIAFLTPTRTLIALNILRRAWANKNETTHVYGRIRWDFFLAGLSAPLDIVGIAAALFCAMLPWPTCIFRLMTLGWKRAGDDVSLKVKNMNQHSFLALYCLVTSLVEMPFAIVSLALGLVTPTRTMATLRVFGNHLYYRASPNVYWMSTFGCNNRANNMTEKPVLLLDSFQLMCGAVLDWITAPALAVVLVGGTARLPKMLAFFRAILDKSKSSSVSQSSQSGAKNHLPSPWPAKPWPFRIDVTTAEPHGGGNGTGFLYALRNSSKDENLEFHMLHHSLHYNMELRYTVWVHFFLVLVDLFVLPFAVVATFGIVHTKYFCRDVKRLWCPGRPRSPATASGAVSAVAMSKNAPMDPAERSTEVAAAKSGAQSGAQSSSAPAKSFADEKAALSEEKQAPDSATSMSGLVTSRHVSASDDGPLLRDHGFNVRLRKSAVYHGIMTVVDIMFLPPIMFVVFSISRAPKMLVQLRNGFDNEARRVILDCTVCAINDLIMLPFLLIVCSPFGMIFGRDRPLWRNFSCCRRETVQDNNSDSDTGSRSAAQPPQDYNLEGDLSRFPPGKLDMTTRSWYFLIIRQFALLMLDLLVLPFTCIVFCTHHMWDHIWHNLLGGYFVQGPVAAGAYVTGSQLSTRLKPITTKDSAAMNLVRENVGPTAVLESAWTPKHYLLDSGLLFHAQMIVHAFIALHDVILFFVALGTACCGFYRMPRVYALVSGYLARIRIGMPIDEKKYQRLVRKTRVKTVSHLQQRLLLQSYWRKKLRSALWFQFQCLLLDIVSLPFVLLTVALAPLRVPNLCRIAAIICKYRCYSCTGSVARDDPDLYDAQSTSSNLDIEMSAVTATSNGLGAEEDRGDFGEEKTSMRHSIAAQPEGKLTTCPFWDGRSRETSQNKQAYEDGFWRVLVLKELNSGVRDLIGLFGIVLTASVAPHRIPNLCRIVAQICKYQCAVCVDHGGRGKSKTTRDSDTSEENRRARVKDDANNVGVAITTTATPAADYNVTTARRIKDGFWRALVLHELKNGIVDLVYFVVALPAIVTLYRWDKILLPIFRPPPGTSVRHIRRNLLRQSLRVLLDVAALPFALIVIVTMVRAYPAVQELVSKMKQACESAPLLLVHDVKSELVGKDGARKATLRFHFRCFLNRSAEQRSAAQSLLLSGKTICKLRVLGEDGLWDSVKSKIGAMAANLGQSAMPIKLNGDNLNMERISEKMKTASEVAASGDEQHPIDFSLTLNLPMKRTTVLKKAKLLSCNTFGFQLETFGSRGEQGNLIAAVLPLPLVTAASSQELDGYSDSGQKNAVGDEEEKDAVVNTNYNDPSCVAKARGTHSEVDANKTSRVRPIYSETDLRDSFARVMLLTFAKLVVDVTHLILSVAVLCLAPWRFFALVYSLCEPKRRFPVRVSGKLMNRLRHSFNLTFHPACDELAFAANKNAKLCGGTQERLNDNFLTALKREDQAFQNFPKSIDSDFAKHDKVSARIVNELDRLEAPFASKVKELVDKRRALRHYTCIRWQLNRARTRGLFNRIGWKNSGSGILGDGDNSETISYLVEELRTAEARWRDECEKTERELNIMQQTWEDEILRSKFRCKKWGCWHHTGAHSRRLVRLFVVLGLNDIAHLMLNLLLLVTLYRLPAFLSDLTSIPGMSASEAVRVFLFKLSGSYRIRRLVHKHTRAMVLDARLLLVNICLFVVVALLVVRLPQYVAYIPVAKSLKDLRNHARECIMESRDAIWEIFALLFAWDSFKLCIRAILFSALMPAAGIADMVWVVAPSCLGDHARSAIGILAWCGMFSGILIIIFGGVLVPNSNALFAFSVVVMAILFASVVLQFCVLRETRFVDENRWSAPAIRLDRFPNIFALLQLPSEAGLLIMLCLLVFHQGGGDNGEGGEAGVVTSGAWSILDRGALHWASIGEDSSRGHSVRVMSWIAIILAFIWVFIISVPLAISDSEKRRRVQQSYFYSTTASLLGGPLFLPIAFGLLLPFNCESVRGATDGNSTYLNATAGNATADKGLLFANTTISDSNAALAPGHHYTCWENDDAQTYGFVGHGTLMAISAELFLVFLLTNVSTAIHDRAENAAAAAAAPIEQQQQQQQQQQRRQRQRQRQRQQRGKDVGLDIIWANAYTSGAKLLQVLLLGAVLAGLDDRVVNEARLMFVVLAFLLSVWTPFYRVALGSACCALQNEKQRTIVASVPWVPWARCFGLISVFFVSIVVHMNQFMVFNPAAVLGIGLGSLTVVGVLVAIAVRQYSRNLRLQSLESSGFTKAFSLLTNIESELMVRKRGLDPKKYERRAWNQRLSSISSARHLAEAVLDFEDHILAENLRPSFIRSRETEFVKHLRRQQKRTVYSSLEKFNAFSDITLALENLRCNLCPPAKYRTMMSLVRCRFERTGLVPKHALGRILEFVGAPLYFKMHEQMCRQLREQVHATSPESKEPLAANDDYGIKSPSPSHGYIIPSDMYSWLNPLSARFRYQAFVANRHICQLAMASTRFQICEDEEGWRNLELVWKSRFRFSSRHEVFRSEPKVWLEAVFNGNSASMYPFLETRSEYRRTNSGPPFVEPRRFDRDIGETISEGIVASWYEPLNTSNTLINKPQDDTKTQVP